MGNSTTKPKKRKKRVPNGQLTQLQNGSWQGRVCIGRSETGPIYQTLTRQSKEELEALILYQRLLYSRTKLTERSKMTVAEWATIWIDEIKYCLIAESTHYSYKSMINNHIIPFLGKKQLVSVRHEDIERFIGFLQKKTKERKPLTPATIKDVYMVINQIMKDAVGAKLILDNPAENVALPRGSSPERVVLTTDEVKRLFDTVNEHFPELYDLYYVELMTGLRRGEMLGLKWSDINESKGEVQIRRTIKYLHGDLLVTNTKTNSGKRKIIFPESVRLLLEERHKRIESEWVFPKEKKPDYPMDPQRVNVNLNKVLKLAGLPYVQFHNLRHTFATQAISNGIEPAVLSNLMGHKIITFTLDRYTHGTIDMQKRMANVIDSYMSDVMEAAPWSEEKRGQEH